MKNKSHFLQNDTLLVPEQLHLTLGTKLEHNDFSGWEFQPNGRLLWTQTANQTVWAAASRAISSPSIVDREARVNFSSFQPSPLGRPVLISILGQPGVTSEELTSYEIGHRIEPTEQLSLDAAAFYNVYHHLMGYVPGPIVFESEPAPHLLSPFITQNSQSGETYGGALSVSWHPTKTLELGIWGQNLLDNQHPEFNSLRTTLQTEIPRGVFGKIT